jgi:hypothetical protein
MLIQDFVQVKAPYASVRDQLLDTSAVGKRGFRYVRGRE